MSAREGFTDAERFRFCVNHDVFPVRGQDGERWVMFVAITSNRRSSFFGTTPSEAVDAAIAATSGAHP